MENYKCILWNTSQYIFIFFRSGYKFNRKELRFGSLSYYKIYHRKFLGIDLYIPIAHGDETLHKFTNDEYCVQLPSLRGNPPE